MHWFGSGAMSDQEGLIVLEAKTLVELEWLQVYYEVHMTGNGSKFGCFVVACPLFV